MRISWTSYELDFRTSRTRIPFRYGAACLTSCPQMVCRVHLEVDGLPVTGFSGDCLPPSWFDKNPDLDFATQVAQMVAAIQVAAQAFRDRLRQPSPFFPAWMDAAAEAARCHSRQGWVPLLSSFGVSVIERAILDALCRRHEISFARAAVTNLWQLEPGAIHPELAGVQPADWLPPAPRQEIWVRHTVGLGDPLSEADVSPDERLDDGRPQTLEQYVRQSGIAYFKVKVANRPAEDLARLRQIADIVQRTRGSRYGVTLDGNEQFTSVAQFGAFLDTLRSDPQLVDFWRNVLVIEQPWARHLAFDPSIVKGLAETVPDKPVIIDESDGELTSYRRAVELGYRGVSSKNCKGPLKSLLNAGLTWFHNRAAGPSGGGGPHEPRRELVMTGEDLCCVGVIPVQSDLCLAATLGLTHVERNGHHFHPGLSYLPLDVQRAALQTHPDFYESIRGVVSPRIREGKLAIASLHGPGFGTEPYR